MRDPVPVTSPPAADGSAPRLSVIVPTHGRPEKIAGLLERLARQCADPECFEVIVVDDGTPEPIQIATAMPYRLTLSHQANAGPAAARNRALLLCQAPLCLILNDDARPAGDIVAGHLAVHDENARGACEKLAVLGSFRFAPSATRASPFVELLDRTDLLFDFSALKHSALHGWQYFWTCNISLPTAALREAGGFDAERFPDIVEDVELGWRLEQRGMRVLYRADLVCDHDHVWTSDAYFERAYRLGRNLARMYVKHGDPSVLRLAPGTVVDERAVGPMQATCETLWPQLSRARERLSKVEAEYAGKRLPDALVTQLEALVARVQAAPFYRGVLGELLGHDLVPVIEHGPPPGRLTSVIALSHDALPMTRRCVEALRASRDPRHPTELLFVDNGSQDGSREWLEAQPDVVLIANAGNAGAPRARNQALARARGEYAVFLDNDALVTPGWLARLLYHLEVDPLAACVGPLSDRAAHGQELGYTGAGDPASLDRFARRLADANYRRYKPATLLSSCCVLVRRALIETIGGFDERFSPWGFEDDDFTLRAVLAGFHNRIALDVFVRREAHPGGGKHARHAGQLHANWGRFREKWGLPADAAHGDYSGLAPLLERPHAALDLHVPIAGRTAPPSAPRKLLAG